MVNCWIVRADDDIRDIVESDEFIGIGYGGTDLGNLSNLLPDQNRSRIKEVHPDKSNQQIGSDLGNIRRFIYNIKLGDIVFTPVQGHNVLIGQVTGEYTFVPAHANKPHRRQILWCDKRSQDEVSLPWSAWQTVLNVNKHESKIAHILSKCVSASEPSGSKIEPSFASIQALAADLLLPASFVEEITTLLEEKKQVIFHGPPGYGQDVRGARAG